CTSGLGGQSAHESEIKNPGFVCRGLDSQMPRLERRGTASESTAAERCLLASTLLIRWYRRVVIALSPLWALVSTVGQAPPVSGGRGHQFGHRFRPIARRHHLNHMEAVRLELLEQRRQRHSGGGVDVVQQ